MAPRFRKQLAMALQSTTLPYERALVRQAESVTAIHFIQRLAKNILFLTAWVEATEWNRLAAFFVFCFSGMDELCFKGCQNYCISMFVSYIII